MLNLIFGNNVLKQLNLNKVNIVLRPEIKWLHDNFYQAKLC